MIRSRMSFALVLAIASTAVADPPRQPRVQFELDGEGRHVRGESQEAEWSVLALDEGGMAVHLLVPFDSLLSDDPSFTEALREASASKGHPYLEVQGVAREKRFEGTLRVAQVEKQVSLPLQARREDGVLLVEVTAPVSPGECGIAFAGHATLTVRLRLPASGNAVLAGGSVHAVNVAH
ncbi:MAG TPA: hypothetical protein VGH20_16955 [Myxococcales bacterium]